jgi:hypothetical protein
MTEPNRFDYFISYADADRAWVEGYLLDALTQAGVSVTSEAAFALGVPRLLEFERAIQRSRRTLLVLSPAYFADNTAAFADLLAQSYGAEAAAWPVIPLLLAPAEAPPRLRMPGLLDATDPTRQAAAIVRLCAEAKRPVPAPPPLPPCPYPGMAPFAEADAGRFFGRDDEIEELLARLRLHPFLALIGPSGCGKSSLVFAGLIPALRRSRLAPAGWTVQVIRPGALTSPPAPPLRGEGGGVGFLLVVDQFEELFTHPIPDAAAFQQALLDLAGRPGCYVVLTVRADFYADLMACPLWPAVQAHRFELPPLDSRGLRQAIVRPAEQAGVYIESALVERLLADAGQEPGVLPFIQETLNLLWEKLERRFLPLRAYEALVLPRAAYGAPPRTGLQVALARRADAALAALTPAQQSIARRIFLRLVQFGEGRPSTRRQLSATALHSQADDTADFERTLAHLAAARLIVLDSRTDENVPRVDLAHEALIQGWPALAGWVIERREAEQTRRRLEAKAEEWVRLGRGSAGLLDAVELAEVDRWLAGPDAADLGYAAELPALAEASRAALAEAARREEAARLRELRLERRARRLLQGLVIVISALLLVSTAYLGRLEMLRLRARAGSAARPIPGLPATLEQYEVTNRRYAFCVEAGRCLSPPPQLSTYHTPGSESRPVAGVDALQAAAFCAWIGRRLPTAAEWQAAATDGAGTRYPWPDDQQIFEFANLHRTGLLDLDRPPDPVGSRKPTAAGIYDLVGNVVEWTATAWSGAGPAAGAAWDGRAAAVPRDLTTVGGSYLATPRSFGPINAAATVRAADLGFRCAEDR